jgi:sialidase-1
VHATGPKRERLAVRVSEDAGRTFREERVLDGGNAAYSDAVLLPDGALLVLYECGERHAYERLSLARIRLPG